MKNKFLILVCFLVLASCATREEIVYFQGVEKLEGLKTQEEFEPVIEINDVLNINVSSMQEEVVLPFQMQINNQQGAGGGGGQSQPIRGYLVDKDGYIQFPVLGRIRVANKSRSELEAFLTEEIKVYVKDAVVAVRLVNFRVIVLGETGQNVVQVQNERISIPELFASVGGISYNGKRENILVIREINGVKSVGRVDMTSADVFTNPYYYLKQNDIVYVEPTLRQVKSAGWITIYQGLVSLFTTAISLYFIITNFGNR